MNFYAYGIHRRQWKVIREEVLNEQFNADEVIKRYELDERQKWFLFDNLLQGKYNHLYKRDKLEPTDIRIGQYVYCDYPEFGRGSIVGVFDFNKMMVKFDDRDLSTMCDSEKMITVHDDIKRKITRL